MSNFDGLVGANGPFHHVSEQVLAYMHEHYLIPDLQPQMLRASQAPDYDSRSHLVSRFQTKGYTLAPVEANQLILIGIVKSCSELLEVCFRGSEAGEAAVMKNIVTGADAVDADGNPVPVEPCYLDDGEVSAAWPASDVYLVRLDCPVSDKATPGSTDLTGVELLTGATGTATAKPVGLEALKETPGGSQWGVVVKPSAAVPDLASVKVVLEVIGRSGV